MQNTLGDHAIEFSTRTVNMPLLVIRIFIDGQPCPLHVSPQSRPVRVVAVAPYQ